MKRKSSKVVHPSFPIWDLEDAIILDSFFKLRYTLCETSAGLGKSQDALKEVLAAWLLKGGNPRDDGAIGQWWKRELANPRRQMYWRREFEKMLRGIERASRRKGKT